MSVLQNVHERLTGMRRANFWDREGVIYTDRSTATIRDAGQSTQEQFALTLSVGATYWANPAQRTQARESAMHLLHASLFADFYPMLAQLRHMIAERDEVGAMEIISKIQAMMEGKWDR